MERVTARGRVMLTGCTVDGRYLARVCVLSFRTRRAEMETCVQHLTEEAAAILATVALVVSGRRTADVRPPSDAARPASPTRIKRHKTLRCRQT